VRDPETSLQSPQEMAHMIFVHQNFVQDLVLALAISPEEEDRFRMFDESVREEYKLNGIKLYDETASKPLLVTDKF
jgi:hypothetical protein